MSWECPNCGHKANEKNFCGMCGCAKPEETPLSGDDIANDNVESNLVEISKNESAELQTENVVADIPRVECNNYQSTHAAADSVKENSVQGNFKVGKTKLIGGIAGILIVISFIIYGLSGSEYQENCADFVAITEELDKTADKIADLPGDATDTERKNVTDDLQKHIDQLDKLSKEIKKSEDKQRKNQDNNSDENFYALRQLVDYEITYLQSIKAAVSYSQEDTGDLSNYVSDEYRQIVDDFNNVYPKYYGLSDIDIEYKDKKTNTKSIASGKEMLRWSKLEDVLSTYIHKKNENDGRKLADLKTKANDKLRENNEDLKKALDSKDYDLAVVGYSLSSVPDARGILEACGIKDKKLSTYIESLGKSTSESETKKIYNQIQKYVVEKASFISLGILDDFIVSNKRLKGTINPNEFDIYKGISNLQMSK